MRGQVGVVFKSLSNLFKGRNLGPFWTLYLSNKVVQRRGEWKEIKREYSQSARRVKRNPQGW